jgi:hypothetical protein
MTALVIDALKGRLQAFVLVSRIFEVEQGFVKWMLPE